MRVYWRFELFDVWQKFLLILSVYLLRFGYSGWRTLMCFFAGFRWKIRKIRENILLSDFQYFSFSDSLAIWDDQENFLKVFAKFFFHGNFISWKISPKSIIISLEKVFLLYLVVLVKGRFFNGDFTLFILKTVKIFVCEKPKMVTIILKQFFLDFLYHFEEEEISEKFVKDL